LPRLSLVSRSRDLSGRLHWERTLFLIPHVAGIGLFLGFFFAHD
jgi:hypothetical protein